MSEFQLPSKISTGKQEQVKSTIQKNIVIIGAGVAGLCAADYLIKQGVSDFVLLEARNRIGGRVIAINIEGRQLELGANWIHGVLGNPIYELASSNGLVPIVQTARPHTVLAAMEDGARLPFAILQEMYEVYSVFLKRCEEYFLCRYLPPEGVNSVGEHLVLERDLYLEQLPEHQRSSRRLVFDYLMRRETCITGAGNLNDVDLLEIGSYTELPGGNISLPAGYSSILRPLAKDIPTDNILKGHAVTVVRWNTARENECIDQERKQGSAGEASEVKTSSSSLPTAGAAEKRKIEIVCGNGTTVYADSVICTVPLGVLKTNAQTLFDPPLPETKLKSIDNLCFGTVDKIYLEYDRPFFSAELGELILLWDSSDITLDMSERWYRKIYSFTKLTDTLLLAWVSGDEAKYMETLPFDVVSEKCTEILRQFLADPFVPKPKRCICTSWWSQPFSRGSYTSIGVGGSQNDIVNLAAPLWARPDDTVPALVFAGEHCHPSFYSTVHGAYLTGRDAARYLCGLPGLGRGDGSTPVSAAQLTSDLVAATMKMDTPVTEEGGDQEEQAQGSSQEGKGSEQAEEITLTVEGTADLSSWLHGISLK